jgi:hypothetical protein
MLTVCLTGGLICWEIRRGSSASNPDSQSSASMSELPTMFGESFHVWSG